MYVDDLAVGRKFCHLKMLMLDINGGLKLTQCTKSLEVLNEILFHAIFRVKFLPFISKLFIVGDKMKTHL